MTAPITPAPSTAIGNEPPWAAYVSGSRREDSSKVRALGAEAGADQVGGLAVALDDPALAVDPGVVVGRRARQRGVEELLAAAADVDGDRGLALAGQLHQQRAQRPRVVVA